MTASAFPGPPQPNAPKPRSKLNVDALACLLPGRCRHHIRLRVSHRAAIATSARSASFTGFESGKASTNSGSRSATLVPRRYLSTYLPRTPPRNHTPLSSPGHAA
jgi:hypothetical protein